MIIVLGWSIAYLKGIQIDFPQIIVRDDRFVARSPNDFSCSLGSSQRTNKEENLKSQEVIITSNAKKQWKVKKKKKPQAKLEDSAPTDGFLSLWIFKDYSTIKAMKSTQKQARTQRET